MQDIIPDKNQIMAENRLKALSFTAHISTAQTKKQIKQTNNNNKKRTIQKPTKFFHRVPKYPSVEYLQTDKSSNHLDWSFYEYKQQQ